MDPGRKAMIEGGRYDCSRPSERRRDVTAPRHDPHTRVSKPAVRNPPPLSSSTSTAKRASAVTSTYQTQDEQSLQFVADEDKFVLRQSKKKADIRVREGRATPVDNLAFYVRFIDPGRDNFDDDDEDAEIDIPAPEAVVEALNVAGLETLDTDIRSFHTLETDQRNKAYWSAVRTLLRDRKKKLRGGHGSNDARAVGSVVEDVDNILRPKTLAQLETLEDQIRAKLDSDADIDVDYWDQLLKSLLVWKAKARLKEIADAVKVARLAVLRKSNPDSADALEHGTTVSGQTSQLATVSNSRPLEPGASSNTVTTTNNPAFPSGVPTSSSSLSTAPPPGTERFADSGNTGGGDFSQATAALYEREVARGIGENEEIFVNEETVPGSVIRPAWADKYRPRKPRSFNRVQMGYEWNKYNQTHYDHDNPPPRVVQGYKFNIFYPDLLDNTRAPTYKIIREGGRRKGESQAPAGQEDTCLIRFTAGPPYEDVAFRIVDREWDYSAKRERGFRSSFDKGILQLHFQFKRIFYRK